MAHIFVDIESFRPCLSKPSYRAPKWALMVRLMQKERLKSPQKSLIIENQAFGVILGHFGQNCHLGHFGQPFPSQGGHADKKSHLGSCLNQQDRATCGFIRVRSHGKPGKKIYWRGCLFSCRFAPGFGFAFFVCKTEFFFAHMGEKKIGAFYSPQTVF